MTMNEGQKRKVGQGMKPRGETAEKTADITAVPTDEGQAESIIQPVLDREEGEQGSEHLEADLVQNLDSAEGPEKSPTVEPFCGFDARLETFFHPTPPEVEQVTAGSLSGLESLQAALEQSGFVKIDASDTPQGVNCYQPTPAEVDKMASVLVREVQKEPLAVERINNIPRIHSLGEQLNGDFKTVVTIQEGYIEGVRQWAEADGKTMEEWLSDFIAGYLENYGSPARSR